MRLRIRHDTTFRFAAPVKSLIHALRLNPRNHEGQHVVKWRIDIDADCRLKASEDAFGNRTHMFDCPGPVESLAILVTGEVEIFDTAGILRESAERMPCELFLRETRLTAADPALRDYAEAIAGREPAALGKLHRLLDRMHSEFELVPGAASGEADNTGGNAGGGTVKTGDVVASKRGTAVELAHAFIAAARHFGIPARCVAGYCIDHQGNGGPLASAQAIVLHVWAEAHVPGLGWIGFDPSSGCCPRDGHVRVAVGLDHLGVAPIRCARNHSCAEAIDSRIMVSSA